MLIEAWMTAADANNDFAVLCLTQMFYFAKNSSNCVRFSG